MIILEIVEVSLRRLISGRGLSIYIYKVYSMLIIYSVQGEEIDRGVMISRRWLLSVPVHCPKQLRPCYKEKFYHRL
jgi:hypothetical protein